MEYENIERHLGLHEDLDITYVVDGFDATLSINDGDRQITGTGNTVREALEDLDKQLKVIPVRNRGL